jgi:8-oxo-dGTP pyrophosphatase MutT (NUDIX family)
METVNSELAGFLVSGRFLTEDSVSWGNMPLKFAYYLSTKQPPVQYVSSVRAIVFRDNDVLVVRGDRNQFYILPGGRRERNESPEETLRRESLEETGWTLKELFILGFMHFHHLGQKPADYPYPYPDFLWLIYTARTDNYISEAIVADEYVRGVEFYPTNELQKLHVEKGELALLDAAIELRQKLRQES